MGAWCPKHVEKVCSNKICILLHHVGVLFNLVGCEWCCVSLWRGFFHTSGILPWPAQDKAIAPVHVGRELNLRHITDDLAHVLEFGGEQFWCPGVAVMLRAEDMCHCQLLWLSEVDVPVMLKASKFHWTDWCVHSNNISNLSLFSEIFLRLYCRHYPTFW